MIVLFGFWLSILVFAIVLVWILVPALYGLPPVPTNRDRIQHALKLANLQPGETLYDLGAGDGRVLFIAARDFQAQAVGIEIGPIQCILVWLRILASGLGNQIKIRWGNFYEANLKDADIVFVYATSKEITKLAPHLAAQMKRGSRLVSISADFVDWEPALVDEHDLIFIYEMPPASGSVTTYLLKREQ
jgi:precorrin-6B methylase 2